MDIGIGTWKENGRELLKSGSRGDKEKAEQSKTQTAKLTHVP